jgi:hypothetical protein
VCASTPALFLLTSAQPHLGCTARRRGRAVRRLVRCLSYSWCGILLVFVYRFDWSRSRAGPGEWYAVTPAPDGGYPNGNTAEGDDALLNLMTGSNNTANAFRALFRNTIGSDNTTIGFQALPASVGIEGTETGARVLDAGRVAIEGLRTLAVLPSPAKP